MKTFVTVIQIAADKVDVFKFNAESAKETYSESHKKGVLVSIIESNKQNDKYSFQLAEELNANIQKIQKIFSGIIMSLTNICNDFEQKHQTPFEVKSLPSKKISFKLGLN